MTLLKGITYNLLPQVSEQEWAEIIPLVGPRIVVRQAAEEIPLRKELSRLEAERDAIEAERDEVNCLIEFAPFEPSLHRGTVTETCSIHPFHISCRSVGHC